MTPENDPQWLKDLLHPERATPKEIGFEELENGDVRLSWERGIAGEKVIAAIDLVIPSKKRADRTITRMLTYGIEEKYMFDYRHVPIGAVKDENGTYVGGVGTSFGAITMVDLNAKLEEVYGEPANPDMYRGLVQWAVDNATPLSTKSVLLSPHVKTSNEAIAAEMIFLASEHLED